MKHCLVLLLLSIVCLVGCEEEDQNSLTIPDSTFKPQPSIDKNYTKELAIQTFLADNDHHNYAISDVVLVEDHALPKLQAVISFYDKENNNSSNLAFIYDHTSREIGFAVNEVAGVQTYEIADDSKLTYIGNGVVSTSIRKIDTNEIINYQIGFSHEESTSTTTITIESEKPSN